MAAKRYLLVDGYNIVFAWDKLAKLAAYSLEDARKKLCDILCDYQGTTTLNIIVVFDAHMVEGGHGSVEPYYNITVVFTKEAETADHYIEHTTRKLSKRDSVTVATSDRLEQIIILSHGAQRISATDLRDNIRAAKNRLKERYLNVKPVKNNPLVGLLDPETAKKLEELRFGKKDETKDD